MKRLLTAVFVVFLIAGVSVAVEKGSFWSTLLKKVNKLVSHSSQGETQTSVIGVRGTKEDTDSDSLYWKGKAEPATGTYTEAEIETFKSAIFLAEQGQDERAIQAFTRFQKEYPDSRLCCDAAMAVDRLQDGGDSESGEGPVVEE